MAERFVVVGLSITGHGPKQMIATFKVRHLKPRADPNGATILVPPISMIVGEDEARKAKDVFYSAPSLVLTLNPSDATLESDDGKLVLALRSHFDR